MGETSIVRTAFHYMDKMRSGEVLLSAREMSRHWGGVIGVNHVSIELRRGEIHALIGTNGAGKSTLINLLSGEIPPTSGTVELLGNDVTRWSQPKRAIWGIGRTYQRNTIHQSFTVVENCRLSAQSHIQRPWEWWLDARRCKASNTAAYKALEMAGLAALSDSIAGALSHGQKRQLEVAMCLATHPKVLLFDEPLAGMGAEETDRMLTLLDSLRPEHAILLVEHDMDAVFRVADQITVMVNGTQVASGAPNEIKRNHDVQTAYLGHLVT